MRITRTDSKIVAMGVAAMVLSGGAGAYAQATVANADKVDGKHAVSATATNAQAAGKLVATGSSGKLPAKFVAKVADADRLDGLDAAAFQRRCAPGSVMARTVVDYLATGPAWSTAPIAEEFTYVCNDQTVLVRRVSTGRYDIALAGLGTTELPTMTAVPTSPGRTASVGVATACSDPEVAGRLCFRVNINNGSVAGDDHFAAVVQ